MCKQLLSRLTIKHALLLFLMLGVIVPLVLFSLFFTTMLNEHLRAIEYESAQLTVQNNAQQLESSVESISYTAAYIITSEETAQYIHAMTNDPQSAEAAFSREYLLKNIRNISNATLYSLNPDISVILTNGAVIGLDYNYKLDDVSHLFAPKRWNEIHCVWKDVLNTSAFGEPSGDLESTWAIRSQNQIIALLRIHIPQENLWDRLSNHPMLQYRQDIINHDAIICTKQTAETTGETSTVLEEPIRNWGMTLRVTVPTAVLTQRMNRQKQLFIVYFVVLILFVLLVLQAITNFITIPIRNVVKQMERLQLGDFSPAAPQNSFQDINRLSDTLNEVSLCISGLMRTASEQATLKESMHYEALMAQINPHFLYNTLNSIRWLATISGNTAVADMLSKLGSTLHYSFGQESQDIALQEELLFLKDYICLLQMRYGNAIAFETKIPEKLWHLRIPRFCLQPLIENSITHGFFSSAAGVSGKIELTAEIRTDCKIQLTICDNGVGMEQEKADQLLCPQQASQKSTGIGVWNVQQRIRLRYGSRYGLTMVSSPGNGCTTQIILPPIP